MITDRETFGKNLQYLRRKKGLNQPQVAAALGIEEVRYCKWEAGVCYPKMTILIRLVDFLEYRDIYRLLTENISSSI